MMLLGIGGQIVSGASQGRPGVSGSVEGKIDFLRLFDRMLQIDVADQVAAWPAPEGLIDISDAPVGEGGSVVTHGSPDTGDGQDQTNRSVDPAVAILIAVVSPPPMGSSSAPLASDLDQVVDPSPPVTPLVPGGESSRRLTTLWSSRSPHGAYRMSEPADAERRLTRKTVGQEAAGTAMSLKGVSAVPPDPRSELDLRVQIVDRGWEGAQVRDIPVEAQRVDVETVRTDAQGSTQPPPLSSQSTRQTPEPFGAPSVEIGPPLQPSAAVLTASIRTEAFEGDAPPPATSDATVPRPSVVNGRTEAPVVTQRPRPHPHGPHPTREVAAMGPTPPLSLADNERSASDDRSAAGSRQPSVSRETRLPLTSTQAAQDGVGRLNEAVTMEPVVGLPSPAPAAKEPTRAADRHVPPSDSPTLLRSEAFELEGSSDRVQARSADGERTVERLESPRLEAPQAVQHDRSTSDSDGRGRASERPLPPPDDGRQIGADFAPPTPSRSLGAEAIRSEPLEPSLRARSLVDQVVDQIVTAARSNPHGEGSRIHLRLHPQTLGELVIEVSWKESGIVAAIKAQSYVAGDALTSELGRLRTALDDQGIPVSDLGVQVGVDLRQWSFEGNGFRAPSGIGYVPEAIVWRDRGSAPPMASAIEPERLIDITV